MVTQLALGTYRGVTGRAEAWEGWWEVVKNIESWAKESRCDFRGVWILLKAFGLGRRVVTQGREAGGGRPPGVALVGTGAVTARTGKRKLVG